jgi:hypothetical protein
VRVDTIKPRNLQAYWPEANPLIRRRVCEVTSGIPDYNAIVEVTPVRAGEREAVGAGAATTA